MRWLKQPQIPVGQATRGLLALVAATVIFIPALRAQTAATPPSVAQVFFAPATISSGAISQLSIVFGNSNAVTATLTQPFLDTLPAGLTLANGTVGGNCTAGAVGAASGGGTITYAAGASIPSGGCSITVNVKGASTSGSTYFTDAIPAGVLHTSLGNSVSGASGTLTVRAAVAVPSLTDKTQAMAAAALQAAGLVLGAVQHGASTVPYNLVFNQTVAVNTLVPAGTAVGITLSNGPGGATNPHAPLTSVPGYVTPGQESVAQAIERVCAALQTPANAPSNALQSNLLANCRSIINTYGGGTSSGGLNNALNAVSGKQATAQQTTSVQFAGLQFSNLASRLAELRGGSTGFSFAGLDTGSPMQSSLGQLVAALQDQSQDPSQDHSQGSPRSSARAVGGGSGDQGDHELLSRWGFFVNGTLRRGTEDTTDDETGYNFRSTGVTAGTDYRFTPNIVGGIAIGHSNGNTEFSDGSGRIDSLSNTVSLYGSYYRDAFYFDAIGTFGHIQYNQNRNTTYTIAADLPSIPTNCVGTECTIETTGSTGARQLAFGGSAGYSFNQSGWVYGPDLALDYTRVNVNGFTESDLNDSGMAVAYDSQIGESLLLKAGGHVSYTISTPIAVFLPQVRARYIHEFKDDQRGLQVHYVNDPTVTTTTAPLSNFFVFTDVPDRNYFDWAVGLTAQFAFGLAGYVDYSALGDYANLRAHELSFGVRFQYLVR